jgi:hypothetical protein
MSEYFVNGYFVNGYFRSSTDTVGNFTFDGSSKLIIINFGISSIDVDDMYSRWVDWVSVSDNVKYPPAIRFVGGDAISSTKDLGLTFFLINGWRVRPQEADHRLTINGNLYTDPSGFSPLVGTVGAFNVMTEMTVSSLVDSSLAQLPEIEQASFNNRIAIDVINGVAGTEYPIGTQKMPARTLADAKLIATARGFDTFYVIGDLTIGATDVVSSFRFQGQGATLNVFKTTITFVQGCVASNTHYYNARITGYQGGESNYHDCIIDGVENAHCIYERCGFIDGTTRGYSIKQSGSVSGAHASYYKECFSDEGTTIIDRNGAKVNVTLDGFSGRVKIINQNNATASGTMWIHLNGGTVTVDASCTKGKIYITGTGTLVNLAQGTEVDASAFLTEGVSQTLITIESLRQTHQGVGYRWFVDPVGGIDTAPGNSSSSPLHTLTAAIAKAVSGRGDVIYLMSPGASAATINERIILDKEDVHIRGPGRGVQIQPSTINLGPVMTITANNCSLSGFIVRTPVGATTDHGIVVSGKFCRMEKLYIVGSGQTGFGAVSSGIVYQGGDYHELYDCEVEKFGDAAVMLDDQSSFHVNGSPREISIMGGNYYLNGGHGLCLHGKPGALSGTTSRIIRILKNVNIHDNLGFGIHSDANVSGVVIDASVLVHDNNGGNENPQAELLGSGYYKEEHIFAQNSVAIWTHPFVSKLLTVAKFLGLK